ncbi:hypothetical protein HWI79_1169 [Cryptosporidium felis]|nr:hypothetical protein HWI79_1169 [Cryptosporidium felis]
MLDVKKTKLLQTEVYESGGGENTYLMNSTFHDENSGRCNLVEHHKKSFPRTKGLPEKLEKHLNSEKERELEALYEENRQLLIEITKLRKTNQLLVKDVTKKKEIIDSLDSNLVEVEEKLENARKKNWNMYNEILNREKKIQERKETENASEIADSENRYDVKTTKFGAFNTVDVVKTPNEKTEINQRPKSTSISTSTENAKWFQEMILESLSEKQAEKRAYDSLKYEIEKLQKEVYSMQTDILKKNQQNPNSLEAINDVVNGKLSIFNSTDSSNNILQSGNNILHSTSLAQELKEVACTANDSSSKNTLEENNHSKENDSGLKNRATVIESSESIPPRSVHILMGKTFSKENNIDKKINHYKALQLRQDPKEIPSEANSNLNPRLPTSLLFQATKNPPPLQPSLYENFQRTQLPIHHPFLTQTLPLSTGFHLPPALSGINPFATLQTQAQEERHLKPPEFRAYPPSTQSHPRHLECESLHFQANYPPPYFSHLHSIYEPAQALPAPGMHPSQFLTQVPTAHSLSLPKFQPPPFKIKIIQKFRRNRNNSVPPGAGDLAHRQPPQGNPASDPPEDSSHDHSAETDLPQGYIRFKTSITSPLSQSEFFSPVSANANQNPCPCDRTAGSCAAISFQSTSRRPMRQRALHPTKARSLSSDIPLSGPQPNQTELLRLSRLQAPAEP